MGPLASWTVLGPWTVLGVTALATFGLARLFTARGWGDAARGEAAHRKLQRRAVPPVGGAALFLGLLLVPRAVREATALEGLGPLGFWGSLAGVFLVGTVDDLRPRGLPPGAKLVGLALALLPAGLDRTGADGLGPVGMFLLLGLVALNVANTFDNADGALGAVALTGFLLPQPWIAAAVLGFLPMNLDAGLPRNRASRAPTAYLGDAGSFVLGFLVLVTPAAWPLLWIPALDLARLAWVRTRAGSRPWVGDRRHLAHRLARSGLPHWAVPLTLVALALPGVIGGAMGGGGPLALGLALGALGFWITLRHSRN